MRASRLLNQADVGMGCRPFFFMVHDGSVETLHLPLIALHVAFDDILVKGHDAALHRSLIPGMALVD